MWNASRFCVSSLRFADAIRLCYLEQLEQFGKVETNETRLKYLEQNLEHLEQNLEQVVSLAAWGPENFR